MSFKEMVMVWMFISIFGCGNEYKLKAGIFQVVSNCPQGNAQGEMKVIDLVGGYELNEGIPFGFPNNTVTLKGSTGRLRSSNSTSSRTCMGNVLRDNATRIHFSCKLHGYHECSISLKQ